MNNLNSSIPKLIVRTQDLTIYTSGTTGQYAATVVSPGALYSGYVCTHIYSSNDAVSVRTSQLDATGRPIRIQMGSAGSHIAWQHTGYDIDGWDPDYDNEIFSMCYCNDPCRAPFAISGETNPSYRNYGETIIGGRPPMG
jgi:hypothetical protein|tara:strand:- start:363 stop:782 length:420 start_codon:yes stop_codon:yes gene_type:complete